MDYIWKIYDETYPSIFGDCVVSPETLLLAPDSGSISGVELHNYWCGLRFVIKLFRAKGWLLSSNLEAFLSRL